MRGASLHSAVVRRAEAVFDDLLRGRDVIAATLRANMWNSEQTWGHFFFLFRRVRALASAQVNHCDGLPLFPVSFESAHLCSLTPDLRDEAKGSIHHAGGGFTPSSGKNMADPNKLPPPPCKAG